MATLSTSFAGLPPDRTEYFTVPFDLREHRGRLTSLRVHQIFPTADTFVMPCWGGGSVRGDRDWLWAAARGCQEHGLLRFDLAGVNGVKRAVLTLTIEGYSSDGDGFALHRMLRPWQEDDSWTTLGGLQPGVDYTPEADYVMPGPHGRGTINIDVTSAARDWARTNQNHGWAVIGFGESSGFRTREWHALSERPRLTVVE